MTNEEIDALPQGREMDALVHQKVLGRRVVFKKGEKIGTQHGLTTGVVGIYSKDIYIDPDDTTLYLHVTDGFTGMIPYYSTNISDAWRIVELLRRGWNNHAAAIIEMIVTDDIDPQDCECRIGSVDIADQCSSAESMPLAICKTALKVALWNENHVQNLPPQ